MKKHPSLVIFGIPVKNATLEELVETSLNLIQQGKKEGRRSNSISTIDLGLIATLFGWRSQTILDSEMLSILRKIDLGIPSGGFMHLLCRLLGSPLQQEIDMQKILFSLCKALEGNEKGLFLLGKEDRATKNAAIDLHEAFKKLRLVGIASPPLYVEGSDLANARERDVLLLEQINGSNAELLIIDLISPKQELWYERVKLALTIPLTLLTNNLLKTDSSRKKFETWMQKSGLMRRGRTFFANLTQQVNGLLNLTKIVWMIFSLVVYHNLNRFVFKLLHSDKHARLETKRNLLFLSARQTIAVLPLPMLVDASNVELLNHHIEETQGHNVLIFDFRKVRHIQPEGFALFMQTWRRRREENKEVYFFSFTADIVHLIKMHRLWDIFKGSACASLDTLMARLVQKESSTFYDAIAQQDSVVIISLLGALDRLIDYEAYLKKLTPIIGQKNCIIDFSYCNCIDNTGFSFLLTLQKQLHAQGQTLKLYSLSKFLKREFRLTKVLSLFSYSSTLP